MEKIPVSTSLIHGYVIALQLPLGASWLHKVMQRIQVTSAAFVLFTGASLPYTMYCSSLTIVDTMVNSSNTDKVICTDKMSVV